MDGRLPRTERFLPVPLPDLLRRLDALWQRHVPPGSEHHIPSHLAAVLALVGMLAIAVPTTLVATTPRIDSSAVAAADTAADHKPVIPETRLPPVEPVALAEVTPDDARSINAAVPFSTAPNPAAAAFRIFGDAADQARAVDCLASAVYYEAGDDPVGQRAVAQVVLNRVRHPAFPNSVCGVVFQGAERSTGCQFTFTCDGALARAPSPAAWERARGIARAALHGEVYSPVGHATHYHTDWVVPYWSSSLEKITEVNTHLFFRWTGWWGTPGAFRRGYAGSEPMEPRLARLSALHAGDGTEEIAEGDVLAPEDFPDAAVPRPLAGDSNSFLVTLDPAIGADSFAALAIRTCGARPYCKFMAWTDRASTPSRLPLSSQQVASMAFSYLRDERQGFAKALWNCNRFERPSPLQCMRAQPLAASTPEPAPPAIDSAAAPAPLAGVRRRGEPQPAPSPAARPPVRFTVPAPAASSSPAGPAPAP